MQEFKGTGEICMSCHEKISKMKQEKPQKIWGIQDPGFGGRCVLVNFIRS